MTRWAPGTRWAARLIGAAVAGSLALAACGPARSEEPAVPRPVTVAGLALTPDRVVDRAALLPPEAEAAIVARSVALQRRTGDQFVVVTLPSLGGESIEDVGLKLGNGWGVGEAGKDNGVLLIVAPAERKVRIEAGKGLAQRLPDARAREIVGAMIPLFRDGEMIKGIEHGVDEIVATLSAAPVETETRKAA